MESLARDFRLALRTLRQSPAFTAVVVLTLALGIGANTAIFTLMDQVLLRMLPVKEPQDLVLLDDPGVFQGFYFGDQTLSFEIGIRMAIGAERSSALWLVLKEVSLLAALGIAIGVPLALALSRLVQSQLFGLTPYDPSTLAVVTALLVLVTLGSGYLPARRATRVDPMSALRYE
jgi:predicted lysophospholipase L1 biosynthesis ABC-type transport system permease subunit